MSRKIGRANRGIFLGATTTFGNNVSFSERKTRRSFKPNAQKKHYFSDIMQETYSINCTARAIKTIRKTGGFDNFLLKKPNLIKDSQFAQKLRSELIFTKGQQEFQLKQLSIKRAEEELKQQGRLFAKPTDTFWN